MNRAFAQVALTGCIFASLTTCDATTLHERARTVASVMARADLPLLLSRPALVAAKYGLMSADAFDFYRGSLALYVHDIQAGTMPIAHSRFALAQPLVWALGDAHPENAGTLAASDGTLALEPNDFDGADRWPFLWELRRLTAGMALAAHVANADDAAAASASAAADRDIARAAAEAYADEMARLASGASRPRITDPGTSTVLADVFQRALRNQSSRLELQEFTTLDGSTRRLIRGPIDPTDLTNTLADLPPFARAAIADTLARYRNTLIAPPDAAFFTVLDAAREFGSGVASFPRVRAIVLVRGPTDDPADDVLLEVKELADSSASGWFAPGVWFDSVQSRVQQSSRALWARPDADPLWGTSSWVGLPVQVRSETEAHKTLRVHRLVGDRGTPDALIAMARALGTLLARVHATPYPGTVSPAASITALIATDREAFLDEQADVSVSYALQVIDDFHEFRAAVQALGPTLGVQPAVDDAPSTDLHALFEQGAPTP